jgi:methylthioribose-1-phosphate isomerase
MALPMKVDGKPWRTIWLEPDGWSIGVIDQTRLPHRFETKRLTTVAEAADAIATMVIRGAPLIGATAAYGMCLALRADASDEALERAYAALLATRPTAVNLRWALDRGRRVFAESRAGGPEAAREALLAWAHRLHAEDVAANRRMGEHGAQLFAQGDRVLTHCNAGALATAGYGTALGVIQSSFRQGTVGMVWVDETRPLLQGARLTAWELRRLGIPFRLVTDSSAGALMARGLVDRIVVGADRIAANGDTANKIGTYTVAVLAHRHGVPFYVAAPLSTIDRGTPTGAEIPIEERETREVTEVLGTAIAPAETTALNFAFDVTPYELIAGIITEVGVLSPPYTESIAAAFAERGAETGL